MSKHEMIPSRGDAKHAEKNKAGAGRPAPRSPRLRVKPRLVLAGLVRLGSRTNRLQTALGRINKDDVNKAAGGNPKVKPNPYSLRSMPLLRGTKH